MSNLWKGSWKINISSGSCSNNLLLTLWSQIMDNTELFMFITTLKIIFFLTSVKELHSEKFRKIQPFFNFNQVIKRFLISNLCFSFFYGAWSSSLNLTAKTSSLSKLAHICIQSNTISCSHCSKWERQEKVCKLLQKYLLIWNRSYLPWVESLKRPKQAFMR